MLFSASHEQNGSARFGQIRKRFIFSVGVVVIMSSNGFDVWDQQAVVVADISSSSSSPKTSSSQSHLSKSVESLSSASGGVWLSWEDLCVDVDLSNGPLRRKTTKRIIHGSRGRVRPGEVVAVMGPSGAGKTSLFNSLAKRGQGYRVSGKLHLNGKPYGKNDLKHVAGFVFQEALFHSHIKTEEALRLAAELKLPKHMSREDKEKRVQVLLDAFDLRRCANTKVGDAKVKGISGGEKKRLSIAIEVLTGPGLLFLDEPTTGLDAASSLMVVKLLRELADNGTSVVMVLHQPRQQILKYIDTFMVLSDGRDVFYGGLPHMIEFFEHIKMPIPLRTNPLDYVLDVINTNEAADELLGKNNNKEPGMEQKSQSFAQVIRGNSMINTVGSQASLLKERKKDSLDGVELAPLPHISRKDLAKHLSEEYRKYGLFEELCAMDPTSMPALDTASTEGSSSFTRLNALLKREFTQKLRNPEVTLTQVAGAIVLSTIIGSIYYLMSPTQVFNKTAGISFASLMVIFLVFHIILLFPVERQIWLRDRDNGLYRSLEYYWSVVIAGMPGDLISSFVLSTILYWMYGLLPNVGNYFTWVGFFFIIINCGSSIMYCFSAIAPSPSVANSLVSVILLFVMIFNGFFIVYNSIPVWYRWIADINFMRFALNVFYFNEFHNQVYNCTVGVDCFYTNGNDVLINLGVPLDLQVWRMAVYMLIVMLVFHCLAMIAITFCYTGAAGEIRDACKARKAGKEIEAEAAAAAAAAENEEKNDEVVKV